MNKGGKNQKGLPPHSEDTKPRDDSKLNILMLFIPWSMNKPEHRFCFAAFYWIIYTLFLSSSLTHPLKRLLNCPIFHCLLTFYFVSSHFRCYFSFISFRLTSVLPYFFPSSAIHCSTLYNKDVSLKVSLGTAIVTGVPVSAGFLCDKGAVLIYVLKDTLYNE